MPFVTVENREIYYERHGQGPALFLLHGAGSNAATWWQQLPVLGQKFTCFTVDLRCFGRSRAPLNEFGFANFTQDIVAIADQEGVESFSIVGQSLGGMVGVRLALEYPTRVQAFIGCDTSLAVNHPGLIALMQKRLASKEVLSIEQRSLGRWFNEQQPALAALYTQINHFNPSALEYTSSAWSSAIGSLMHPDHLLPLDALKKISCPCLLVVGTEDPLVSVQSMHDVSQYLNGANVAVIADAGHSAYFEKPVEVNRHIVSFLETVL